MLEVCTIICLGVKRHLVSGHEISTLHHGLQLIMARYTRIINCRPCCNLYVSCAFTGDTVLRCGLIMNRIVLYCTQCGSVPESCFNNKLTLDFQFETYRQRTSLFASLCCSPPKKSAARWNFQYVHGTLHLNLNINDVD